VKLENFLLVGFTLPAGQEQETEIPEV